MSAAHIFSRRIKLAPANVTGRSSRPKIAFIHTHVNLQITKKDILERNRTTPTMRNPAQSRPRQGKYREGRNNLMVFEVSARLASARGSASGLLSHHTISADSKGLPTSDQHLILSIYLADRSIPSPDHNGSGVVCAG